MAGKDKSPKMPSLAERLKQTAEKRDRESVIVPPPGDAAKLRVAEDEPDENVEVVAAADESVEEATAAAELDDADAESINGTNPSHSNGVFEKPVKSPEAEAVEAEVDEEDEKKDEREQRVDHHEEMESFVSGGFSAASLDDDEPPASQRVRSRRRPRVTRTYEGARRSVLSLMLFPVFAIFIVAEAVRELSYRIRRDKAREQPRVAHFERPATMPGKKDERSVADVVEHLRKFPHDPLPMPTSMAFFREYGAEGVNVLFSHMPELTTLTHKYPGVFKQRLFTGYDGVKLAGLQAMHDAPRPALIICHGLQTNKNFDFVRRVAKRAYADWGFHVATFDMRGWGQSLWTTDRPSSVGWHEAQDVLEIARELHKDPRVTSVGIIGFSLGGLTVLNASRFSGQADDCPVDGGILAVSAPTDIHQAIEYISTRPNIRHPFFGLWAIWQATLRAAGRRAGLPAEVNTWTKMVKATSVDYYGVSYDDMLTRPSPLQWAEELTLPTLAMHARDDFVVGVEHAEALMQVTENNPNVHVWLTDVGNHCAFSTVDPRWFYSVVRRWFEYWAKEPD